MKAKFFCISIVLALAAINARAQNGPYTPEQGSVERQSVMDTIRPLVERDLSQQVVFRVSRLSVQNGWAFMIATPQQPDGRAVDFSRTRFRRAYEQGMFSDVVIALVRRQGNRWRVVRYVLGPTDVPYEDWPRRYRAPRAIFGMETH